MSRDIRQAFLDHPVHRGRCGFVELVIERLVHKQRLHPCAARKVIQQPLQGRFQPQIVQDGGMESIRHKPHIVRQLLQPLQGVADTLLSFCRSGPDLSVDCLQIQHQQGEPLIDVIM